MLIGNYFAFIIIMMGTLLADKNISNNVKRQFVKNILYSHNRYRRIHNVSELSLNNAMCNIAKNLMTKWTDNPYTMEIPDMYGSNTYTVNYTKKTVLNSYKIFDNWYYYSTIYDYSQEPLFPKSTNPFTQVVWKSTKEIGVGISGKRGVLKILVLYFPAGNQLGQYMSNVILPRAMNLSLNNEEKEKFFTDIVNSHNHYRRNHYSSNLVIDDEMCILAETHMNEWVTNQPITLSNSYGLNCYQMPFNGISELDPKTIVLSWYKNHIFYNYNNENSEPSSLQQTNPFTQVVWRSTEKIGVGIIVLNNVVNVLVMYSPAGNQPGQYMSNVLIPRVAKVELTDTVKQKFFQDIVDSHNHYRQNHYSSNVDLDDEMCILAETHLNEWVTNQPITLSNSYGFNTYQMPLSGMSELDPKKIVLSWYKNHIFYNYNIDNSEFSSLDQTNPFTQVVWRSTEKIGVGIVMINKVLNVLVMYSPAGNQPGQYMSNVLLPRDAIVELTDTTIQTFRQSILDLHNYYRGLHYSSIVELDDDMCVKADTYLNELTSNKPITLSKRYGMNYYQMPFNGISELDPKKVVLFWYKKQIYYNFNYEHSFMDPSSLEQTNSFTQVVWKSTEKIGVGILIINGIVNVVVLYYPAGNKLGEYTSNVSGPPNIDSKDQLYFHRQML